MRIGISPYNFPTSTASPELKRIVGAGVLEKAEELGVVTKLWAALMAVAYLRGNLQTKPHLLDAALAKAQIRRRGSLPPQFEDMFRQVSEILRMAQEDKLKLEGLDRRNPLTMASTVCSDRLWVNNVLLQMTALTRGGHTFYCTNATVPDEF